MNRSAGPALALSVALLIAPAARADPSVEPGPGGVPTPAHSEVPAAVFGAPTERTDVVDAVCTQFGEALNLAAASYDEFAYASAGTGDAVNYADEEVWRSNLVGRTALREAAGTALSLSRTPGLPPEVSTPMRAWSLRATKLLVIMGLRRGGDSLNSAASRLNVDANEVQVACAG